MRRSSSAISALFLSFGSNLALFVRSVLRSRTVLVAENLFLRKQIAFYCEHQRLTAFSSTIVDSIFSAELDQELSQGSATTIPDVRTPASGRAFPGCAQMSPSAGWKLLVGRDHITHGVRQQRCQKIPSWLVLGSFSCHPYPDTVIRSAPKSPTQLQQLALRHREDHLRLLAVCLHQHEIL
jgi:hypothetical protein